MTTFSSKIGFFAFFCLIFSTLLLSGCSGVQTGEGYTNPATDKMARDKQQPSVFGSDGLSFGGSKSKADQSSGGGIGVNAFLWRASLDTVSFMPLMSADPFGGVIITDWYAPGETEVKTERFKLTVYILGKELRADSIKVSAFKQVWSGKTNSWMDAAPDSNTGTKIENSILSRARELRVAAEKK